MKKVTLIVAILLLGMVVLAQEQEKSFLSKKNEVKVNLPVSIFGKFPEVSYERILQEDVSLGASLGISLDDGDTYGFKAQFTPYVRWFFGGNRDSARKYAAGFFIEANTSVFSREDLKDTHYYDYNERNCGNEGITYGGCVFPDEPEFETKIGAGLGLGIGWKFLTKNNWCGQILLGGGKDFSNSGDGYPHFGISIGKRF